MAVAFDAKSESHTGTSGSASEASFQWDHTGGASARGALVFVFTYADADYITSVTYGGTTMSQVGEAAAGTTEAGRCTAFYLDNCGGGTKTVVVTRTNNTTVMYAVCATVTANGPTEVYAAGIQTQTTLGQLGLVSVNDGSPGYNSLRFAAVAAGVPNITLQTTGVIAGSGSTELHGLDTGARVSYSVYESTPGQGSRNVGFASDVTSDDRAAVYLAVRQTGEIISPAQGALAGTGQAPTVTVSRQVRVGWARLVVPYAADTNTYAYPTQGAATATGQTPTVTQSQHVICSPGCGSLTVTGQAPVAFRQDGVYPAQGSATATGQAPTASVTDNRNIAVAQGAVVATGYAPSADRTDNQVAGPPQGAITATGYAPTATASANQYAYPSSGSVQASGQAPDAGLTHTASPDVGAAALTGHAPSANSGDSRTAQPDAGAATFAGQAPTATNSGDRWVRMGWARLVTPTAQGDQTVAPDVGSLTATGQAPFLQAQTFVTPDVGSASFTGQAPTAGTISVLIEWDDITGEDGYRIKWGLAPDTYSWSADVAADVTSYTIRGLVYATNYYVRIYGLVGGVEQDPSAEILLTAGFGYAPDQASLTLTGQAPTVSVGGNTSVAPTQGAAAFTGQAPTPGLTHTASPTQGAAAFVGLAPTTLVTIQAAPDVGSVTVTGHAPTVAVSDQRQASPETGAIGATGHAPTVSATDSRLAYPDAGNAAFSGLAPTVEVSELGSRTIEVGCGTLTATGFATTRPGIEYDYSWIPYPGGPKPKKPKTRSEVEAEERQFAPDEPSVVTETADTHTLPPDVPVVVYPTLDMTPVVVSKRKRSKRRIERMIDDDDEDVLLLL